MFRDYFIMLRKFIDYYKDHFANKIIELTKTEKFMYILLVNKTKNIFKIGRTGDIRKRLQAYSTGKETHPDIKFIMIVNDDKKVEQCNKLFIKVKQFRENRELYRANIDYLKSAIYNCAKLDENLKKEIETSEKYNSYVIFDDANTLEYLDLKTNTLNTHSIHSNESITSKKKTITKTTNKTKKNNTK